MADLENIARRFAKGEIDGNALAGMVEKSEITKQERRRITKISHAIAKKDAKVLSKRQLERIATKEKKLLPKVTAEERKRRFHEALEKERELEAAKFTICLGCRKRGHWLKDCPKAAKEVKDIHSDNICFNCGSKEHTLKNCFEPRDPKGKLPFATCFICKQMGHLSRECPENANGVYPKGGCCHICLQKTHLARDCPDRTEEHNKKEDFDGVRMGGLVASSEDRFGGDDVLDTAPVVDESDIESDSAPKKKRKTRSK